MIHLIRLINLKMKLKIEFNTKQLQSELISQILISLSFSVSQKWVSSQSWHYDDFETDSDENLLTFTFYLWGKTQQRRPSKFTSEHKPVVLMCLSYLKTWIISSHMRYESTSWSKMNKSWLNDRMSEAWRKIIKQLKGTSDCKHLKVNDVSITLKAHKVNNESMSVWYSANIHSYITSLKHSADI